MGLISFTPLQDGVTSVNAAATNTPLNTIFNEFNGNIDNNNIKSAANISGTKLADGTIPASKSDTASNVVTRLSEETFDFVASGCVWSGDSYGSTLNASMTSGVVYISGVRIPVSAVTAHAFTASKDTYVDVDGSGTVHYTEAANNAASPALTSGWIRVAIIVTGANIANVGSVNQGQETKVLPIASSVPYAVTDSLGNLICPRDPNRKILGYRIYTGTQASITTAVAVTPLVCPVIIPTGRKVKVTTTGLIQSTVADDTAQLFIQDTTASGNIQIGQMLCRPANINNSVTADIVVTPPASGSRTYTTLVGRGAGTGSLSAVGTSTQPFFIRVELA